MKKCLILAVLLLNAIVIKAQSANLDREYFNVSHVVLPSNPILNDADRTYNLRVLNTIDKQARKDIVRNDINIQGYTKLPNKGVLDIAIEINPVQIGEVEIKKTEIENKDKEGNVKSITRIYNVIFPYQTNGKMVVLNTISGETKSFNYGKSEVFRSKDFKTNTLANDYYKNNYTNLRDGFNTSFFNTVVSNANTRLNSLYGYKIKSGQDYFWILDSKKHPETPKHKEMYEVMKTAFSKMRSDLAVDELALELAPAIAYFESVPANYPGDKKRIRKLKYASYYNLAQLYYYLDQPEKVIEYSEKLIANNYDKSDGKSMIKYANALRKDLDKNQVKSRHFKVVTEDRSNDPSLQPAVVEAPIVKTIIIEKKDPDFLVLQGSVEQINDQLKKVLYSINVARQIWTTSYIHPGPYIYNQSNKQIIGRKYYEAYENRESDVLFTIEGDHIVGATMKDFETTLYWINNQLTRIHAPGLSQFNFDISYDSDKRPIAFSNTYDREGTDYLTTVAYDGLRISKIIRNWNTGSRKWTHTIRTMEEVGDTIVTKEIMYKQRKKNKPENILHEYVYKSKRIGDKYLVSINPFGGIREYTYNDDGLIEISKSFDKDNRTVDQNFYYEGTKKTQRVLVRKKDGIMYEREILNYVDLKKTDATSPEYQWRKGTYRFNENNELVWEARNSQWRKKINGAWTGWQYFRM
ncbi:hypothetical protein [Spongiivirga citrea]|uniref:Uncharacterized protein n=1 Tax=Spongiivirga citrea TaxID=1481457 RepID=A0A6M0CL70_9FLAO|nr:hypothetical protein [Spongiivirga citrea]NER18705.1 hypothetical protein [Spongiivirga citrea]